MTTSPSSCPLCKVPLEQDVTGNHLVCTNKNCENFVVYDIRKDAKVRMTS